MHNTILYAWVKNVYRQSNNRFTNSDISSPTTITHYQYQPSINVQLQVCNLFLTTFADQLYTLKNYIFNLLNDSYTYYPQALLLRALKRI